MQSNMSQSTRDDLNNVIAFNLKEDGNITISSLNRESLVVLDQYLDKEFSSNPGLGKNADLTQAQERITAALE
jgi:U3 small nucleolar RNA-associated protein 14